MLRSFASVAALALLAAAASACSASPGDGASAIASEGEAASKTTYLDIADYWTTGPQQDTWFAAVGNLKQQFDAICGDTFCEGDDSNLQALALTCAVSKARGSVKSCTWEFVGSYEVVNAATGAVKASAPHYACSFDPTGDAAHLAAFLGAAGSLRAPLPGLTKSVYDGRRPTTRWAGACRRSVVARAGFSGDTRVPRDGAGGRGTARHRVIGAQTAAAREKLRARLWHAT